MIANPIHRGVINALQFAKSISHNGVRVYDTLTMRLRKQAEMGQGGSGVGLVVLQSPYRSLRHFFTTVALAVRTGRTSFVVPGLFRLVGGNGAAVKFCC